MKKNNNNISIKKILLAAGISKRYGYKNKLTEKIKGKYLIEHVIDTLLKVFDTRDLLVIVGHDFKKIINLINNDIKIINNNKYKDGIGTSISLGVKHLGPNVQGVMIIPADMPLIAAKDLKKLERQFLQLSCKKVVLPKYKNITGNPVILPKSYFSTLRNLKKDYGARSQIKDNDIVTVSCDIGTIFDVDTSNALQKALIILKN